MIIYKKRLDLFEGKIIPCVYCGQPYDDLEHVIPRYYQAKFSKLHEVIYSDIVPSCHECNLLAGRELFFTVEDKKDYIKGKLRKRYKKILRLPEWTTEELNELSPSICTSILNKVALQRTIKERLSY